jgi:hypothetical protein
MSARYIELTSFTVSSTKRAFNVPGEAVVPRGYYMLFALDNNDIPSVAKWVKVVL